MKSLPFLISFTLLISCTTTDPYTGETYADNNATTAAVIGGLALAAAAYAASNDDDDTSEHRHHRRHKDYRYEPAQRQRRYSPVRGVQCYDARRVCYRDGHFSQKWTRREYGR